MKRIKWAYRQPRVEGGRHNRSAGLAPEVEKWLMRECERFDASPPFVISVALADYLGLKIKSYK